MGFDASLRAIIAGLVLDAKLLLRSLMMFFFFLFFFVFFLFCFGGGGGCNKYISELSFILELSHIYKLDYIEIQNVYLFASSLKTSFKT